MSRENKNIEPQFDDKNIFREFAEILVMRGKIHETDNPEDGRGFVLGNIPPLTDSGVKAVEFKPEYVFEGEVYTDTLYFTFLDNLLDKSILLSRDPRTGKIRASVIVEPKQEMPIVLSQEEGAHIEEAITNLLSGVRSEDPDIRRQEERIHFMLTADDTPSPDDMLAIEMALRRLKVYPGL